MTADFELKIHDKSDHIKQFSLRREIAYISIPYFVFAIIALIITLSILFRQEYIKSTRNYISFY